MFTVIMHWWEGVGGGVGDMERSEGREKERDGVCVWGGGVGGGGER